MAEAFAIKSPAKVNQYEGMFLFGAAAAQDNQAALTLVRSMVERHGGEVLVLKKWDERKLAYEINGQKRGTYVICYFKAAGPAVTPIERDVKLSEEVLRVMITDAGHLNQQEMEAVEPQPIQRVEERNPWDRPYGDRGPRDDRGPREDRGPRDDRGGPREDRAPREDRPPRAPRREEQPAEAGAAKE